jgi:hypothetical protein
MNALGLIEERSSSRRHERVIGMLAACLTPTLIVAATAVLLVWRRSAGALTTPPAAAVAACCAAALIGLDAARRILIRRTLGDHDVELPGPWLLPLMLAPLVHWVAVAVIAAALTLPGSKPAAIALLWAPVIASTALVAYRRFAAPSEVPPAAPRLMMHEPPVAPVRRLRQETTRFIDAAGRDVIEGTTVAEFAPGQRQASLHLAFCPPFVRAPEIACGVASGAAAEVKVVQALAYAARFDVKLTSVAATALEVPVSFSARCAE